MPIIKTDWSILVKLKDLANSLGISNQLNTKLFAEIFPENSNLDEIGSSQLAFSTRANLKQHDTHKTPKTVLDRAALDSSKGSGPDSITVVVLQTCKPKLLYILVYFFFMSFPDY